MKNSTKTIECPKWNVYFSGNFWGYTGKEKPGTEIPIRKEFIWAEETWLIPSIYSCGVGLVVDLCKKLEPERVQAYFDKWYTQSKQETLSDEEYEQIEAESLSPDSSFNAVLNGRELSFDHSCSMVWYPYLPEEESNDLEAEKAMEYYHCDRQYGWVFLRAAFFWATKSKPVIHKLELTLKQEALRFAGPHFTTENFEQTVDFVHPFTKQKHVLSVISCTDEYLSEEAFSENNDLWPRCFKRLTYTLTPDLPDQSFSIQDCSHGDSPQQKPEEPIETSDETSSDLAAASIIGGACGPTVIFLAGKNSNPFQHTALSSLHYEPVNGVEWRMIFHEKIKEDISIEMQL